ncbi:MAG: enoyl-CoA hydratase-related protein [Candidatus Electryonea clarkiae]|nr:enoyl-CoA hydratase-related protein [Candidatus Electryonea clarkiae]MDP8287623.1 enoyl-CoA hydratase-related protein [Candidatus Electryonea clarkiae]
MDFNNLLYEVADNIATIKINRPKALNALNAETVNELYSAIRSAGFDDDVHAVIITGEGNRSFVAGADIKELATNGPIEGKDFAVRGQRIFNAISMLKKPVIAAINGFALGGGCELAMACHIRYAHTSAKFGQPEVGLGIIPGYGGTQRLPRLIGMGLALELLISGEIISAQRAYELGLVNAVFDSWVVDDNGEPVLNEKGRKTMDVEGFLAEVKKKLSVILSHGPVVVRFALEAARRGASCSLDEGQRIEADLFGLACTTDDFKEGTSAFIEKRKAEFKGK